ncbi:VOC family protein [Novosphingobium sp.]|uniref:VOC family protein n=1 Tax=Novosphingobium sp. TaxID=1874826 RepID=UPI00286E4746|nr:VOC family protein [Novosphingobium sp.]
MRLIAAAMLANCLPAAANAQASAAPAISPEGMVGPALYVTDPARSLKFYTEGLGMKLRMRFGPADRPDMVVGFGPNPAEAGIMFVTDKTGPIRPIAHAHGFDRIAMRMPDLAGVAARLERLGFKGGEIKLVHGAIRMMMVTDPDGYRLELIETPGKPAS